MIFRRWQEALQGVLDGIPYVQAAIRSNVGEWGIHFITFSIFAFAFSSLIGNYFYAESNILFIKNNKVVLTVFRITCMIATFLLGNVAFKALKHYELKKKQGENMIFYEDEIGLTGTVWTRDSKEV